MTASKVTNEILFVLKNKEVKISYSVNIFGIRIRDIFIGYELLIFI